MARWRRSFQFRVDGLLGALTGVCILGAAAVGWLAWQQLGALQTRELEQTHAEARLELAMATAVTVALLTVGTLAFGLVSRRILRPLVGLRGMFDRLSSGDFSQLSIDGLDPALGRLFDNYNQLVSRLEELEEDDRVRAKSLAGEVQLAAQTLLEQQSTLARSERLAAVGEMGRAWPTNSAIRSRQFA